jgi:transcriptional regulator with XRE-family HTH domain
VNRPPPERKKRAVQDSSIGGGLGERIRAALIGRSVQQTASELGVTPSAIYNWISGTNEPNLSKLVGLARATNVSIAWLAANEGEVRPGELPGYIKPAYPLDPSWPPVIFEKRYVEDFESGSIGPSDASFPLVLIKAPDDAMEDTLRKGDLVLARNDGADRTSGLYLIVRTRAEPGEQIIPFRRAQNLVGFELDLEHPRLAEPDEDIGENFVLDSKGHLMQRFFPRRVEWSIKGSAIVKCDNPAYSQVIEITDPKKQGIAVRHRVIWHSGLI